MAHERCLPYADLQRLGPAGRLIVQGRCMNIGRPTEILHPGIQRRGLLLTVEADGPLGRVGDTLLLPDDEVISPYVRAHAAWDPENVGSFASKVKANQRYVLIDVGANIGLFSRQLAIRCPQVSDILCVEPDPDNFKALQYNLAELSDRVQYFQVALSDTDGRAIFFRDTENIGNYSLAADAMRTRPHDTREISVRDTARWLADNVPAGRPLLWKSDTQGFDELIVSLVPWDVWQRVDVALMEVWRIKKPTMDREALARRIDSFPNKVLGDRGPVSTMDVLTYSDGDDMLFLDLLMWR